MEFFTKVYTYSYAFFFVFFNSTQKAVGMLHVPFLPPNGNIVTHFGCDSFHPTESASTELVVQCLAALKVLHGKVPIQEISVSYHTSHNISHHIIHKRERDGKVDTPKAGGGGSPMCHTRMHVFFEVEVAQITCDSFHRKLAWTGIECTKIARFRISCGRN